MCQDTERGHDRRRLHGQGPRARLRGDADVLLAGAGHPGPQGRGRRDRRTRRGGASATASSEAPATGARRRRPGDRRRRHRHAERQPRGDRDRRGRGRQAHHLREAARAHAATRPDHARRGDARRASSTWSPSTTGARPRSRWRASTSRKAASAEILNFRGTYLQDWSADPDSPLSWRFQKSVAGSGALGDIGTHVARPRALPGRRDRRGQRARPQPTSRRARCKRAASTSSAPPRRAPSAERGEVDVDDEVHDARCDSRTAPIGSLEATRNAYGRNNFLTFEIHGTEGSIAFNYERRDELQVMFADDPADRAGLSHGLSPARRTLTARACGRSRRSASATARRRSSSATISCRRSHRVSSLRRISRTATGSQVICEAIERSAETGAWVELEGCTESSEASPESPLLRLRPSARASPASGAARGGLRPPPGRGPRAPRRQRRRQVDADEDRRGRAHARRGADRGRGRRGPPALAHDCARATASP